VDLDLEKFFDQVNHDRRFVDSERAGQRVMESITHFITHRLKLKVNQAKSAVARQGKGSFLDPVYWRTRTSAGGSPQRQSLASKSGFGHRRAEPVASDAQGTSGLPARLARVLRRLSNAFGAATS
jgi:hypothetical protein